MSNNECVEMTSKEVVHDLDGSIVGQALTMLNEPQNFKDFSSKIAGAERPGDSTLPKFSLTNGNEIHEPNSVCFCGRTPPDGPVVPGPKDSPKDPGITPSADRPGPDPFPHYPDNGCVAIPPEPIPYHPGPDPFLHYPDNGCAAIPPEPFAIHGGPEDSRN